MIYVTAAMLFGGFLILAFVRWVGGAPKVVLKQEERHPYRWVQQKEQTRTCERCGAEWKTKP